MKRELGGPHPGWRLSRGPADPTLEARCPARAAGRPRASSSRSWCSRAGSTRRTAARPTRCCGSTARLIAASSRAIPTRCGASTPPRCSRGCRLVDRRKPGGGRCGTGAARRRDRARQRERPAPQRCAARRVDLPPWHRPRAARRRALPARHPRGPPGQPRRARAPIRPRCARPLDGAHRPRVAPAGPRRGAAALPAPRGPLPAPAARRRGDRRRSGGAGGHPHRIGRPERRVAALDRRPHPRAADRPPRPQRVVARAVVVRRALAAAPAAARELRGRPAAPPAARPRLGRPVPAQQRRPLVAVLRGGPVARRPRAHQRRRARRVGRPARRAGRARHAPPPLVPVRLHPRRQRLPAARVAHVLGHHALPRAVASGRLDTRVRARRHRALRPDAAAAGRGVVAVRHRRGAGRVPGRRAPPVPRAGTRRAVARAPAQPDRLRRPRRAAGGPAHPRRRPAAAPRPGLLRALRARGRLQGDARAEPDRATARSRWRGSSPTGSRATSRPTTTRPTQRWAATDALRRRRRW